MNEPNRFETVSEDGSRVGLKPGWFIGMGIVLIILGIVACIDAFSVTLASTMVLGIVVMAGGIVQLIQGIVHFHSGQRGHWANLLIGCFVLFAGLVLCVEPIAGSQVLTAIMAGLLMLGGFSRIFWSVGMRQNLPDWWVGALSGAVTLVVGCLLYWYLPWSGLFPRYLDSD